ncbi:17-beta-hydroxysteroid dehydrogenase 13-like [Anopheles aquasalis]|uniref:17-beta-hydroxysteroid dehydrogenase 13-like n=1 Tax=Anopheles aquasalis TaxID=42839 RepID=UPI00215AC00A|nr:17-beta-hydroxysteroid dehydrogenase 13-like [Anopheles aquasalis]
MKFVIPATVSEHSTASSDRSHACSLARRAIAFSLHRDLNGIGSCFTWISKMNSAGCVALNSPSATAAGLGCEIGYDAGDNDDNRVTAITDRPAAPAAAPQSPTGMQYKLFLVLETLLTVVLIAIDLVKVIVLALGPLLYEIYTMAVPRRQKDVRGQLVLITGGGNGLGRAMAHLLAARGAHLVLVDIDLEAAERTCAELRCGGTTKAWAYRVDVSRYEECRELAERMERDGCGPVDVLINNAGIILFAFVGEASVERENAVMDVNLKSHVWMTRVFLDGMVKRKKGHIVGVSSMSGMYAFPWGVVYSATKFAVSGFMASLTEQLRIQGLSRYVRTTCVNPYYVTTRKEVVEFLQKPRFEALTVDKAAEEIVQGILRQDFVVTVPRLFGVFTRFMLLFPVRVQQLVRDYIMREHELNDKINR